ncbi:WhiB family transcriptional regulator [Streptomyces sp. NBC_00566]|uniref:WhiB family transcriptional regulator n=1 Tax=Streptomyces sp. NBC_00566 TaxID=2975778 RepID=UPI002E806E34|nr:WhiB family transcriptional regulator [Streptomyces sp. NBC_00566]WUB88232.1 WhiB family transcriptional regulator [Streptomyces sp. NBC_00566]
MAATAGLPCRTTDPELWFSGSSSDRALAVALCRECPLQRECAQHALDRPELRGVWGATTAADRRGFRTGEQHRLDEQGRVRMLCGSERAYRSHFAYGERPGTDCVAGDCVAAHEAHVTAERRSRLAAEHALPDGGSAAGYWMHRRLGEPSCGACYEAHRAQQAIARARRGLQLPRTASPTSGPTATLPGAQPGVHGLAAAS